MDICYGVKFNPEIVAQLHSRKIWFSESRRILNSLVAGEEPYIVLDDIGYREIAIYLREKNRPKTAAAFLAMGKESTRRFKARLEIWDEEENEDDTDEDTDEENE